MIPTTEGRNYSSHLFKVACIWGWQPRAGKAGSTLTWGDRPAFLCAPAAGQPLCSPDSPAVKGNLAPPPQAGVLGTLMPTKFSAEAWDIFFSRSTLYFSGISRRPQWDSWKQWNSVSPICMTPFQELLCYCFHFMENRILASQAK